MERKNKGGFIKIYIDTREKLPLTFEGVETVSKKLDFADYGCELSDGHIVPISMERKSCSDIFSTLTSQYERFRAEIVRSQEAKFRMFIIIEGTLTKVGKGVKHCKRNPEALLDQLFTIFVKYKIIPIFCKDPQEASRWIYLFYKAYEKNYYINKNDKY